MPAPYVPVMDNFSSGSANPPNSKWTGPIFGDPQHMQVKGGALTTVTGTPDSNGDSTSVNYGPDCECFITITTPVSASGALRMYLRGAAMNNGATINAYRLKLDWAASTWTIGRTDLGSTTTLATGSYSTLVTGFWLKIRGASLTAYTRTNGLWSSVGTATDSTYAGAGGTGLELSDTSASTMKLKDFGVGTLPRGGLSAQGGIQG